MTHKLFTSISLLIFSLLAVVGCKEDDALGETTKDCMVKEAVLGTLSRTVYTKDSQGQTSTYTVSLLGSDYPLSIDQSNNRIFNAEPLPYGTNLSSVAFSTFSATGHLAIKETGSERYNNYTSTTADNFSVTRYIRVYTQDGSRFRTYTVELKTYEANATDWKWDSFTPKEGTEENSPSIFAAFSNLRSLVKDGCIYVWGNKGEGVQLATAQTDALGAWQTASLSQNIDPRSIQLFGASFYALQDGQVMTSTDGFEWSNSGSADEFDYLVAAGTKELVAVKDDSLYYSLDGIEWEPYRNFTPDASTPNTYVGLRFDASLTSMDHLLLLSCDGNSTRVWKKDVDYSEGGTYTLDWMLYPYEEGALPCPNLKDMQLTPYDNKVLLAGLATDGSIAPLYMSADKGRTWRKGGNYNLPDAKKATGLTITSDKEDFLYVIYSGSGTVWRGRMNRLAWEKE